MAVVELRQVRKAFGGHAAVDGIDLSIRDGELLVLVGPSGCGKSTLLRMIAGLERQTSGDILIGGRVVNELPPRERNVAMVFQSYALYPHLTVEKNIAFPLEAQRAARAEIASRVQAAARMFGIERLLSRKPRELSGGERQRVALARATVREPDVFLLDEPLSNLDARLRLSAREELQELQRRIGTTTIYVTHDQVEAMALGDRIAVMNAGAIRQLATPREVYEEPADRFVAGFIGSPPMNLLDRGDVIVGMRPEHLAPRRADAGETAIAVELERVEHLGAERLLHARTVALAARTRIIASLPSRAPFDALPGARLDLAIRTADLRFFDRQSGLRVAPRT